VSIGEALADARRDAGLTVTEVGEQAGIREMIITHIEDDDYFICGGHSYARGYIRIIAGALRADPEPLIREYNTTIADDVSTPVIRRRRLRPSWVVVLVLVWAGIAAYDLRAGLPRATSAATSARVHSVTHRPAAHAGPVPPAPKRSITSGVPVRTLTPVSAAAFGPSGTGQGDAPQLAPLAIDGNPATAWHTDWYATAGFGGLYAGTGLLLDMGRTATITAARITLGADQGASFQLRVGAAPLLAGLPPVAQAVNTAGVVYLRLTTPAHGRYVLIWFTSLPRDPAGTFQASVSDIHLDGQS
jgi:eukaryotic-like serine/threonine-protein kinase